MTNKKFALLLIFFSISNFDTVKSANILVYGAVATHSIRLSVFPTIEALAEKGHSVTYLSPYDNFEDPQKKSKVNYYTPEPWKKAMPTWDSGLFEVRKQGAIPQAWMDFHHLGILACQTLYSDPDFVNWVKTAKYDLIIMESALNECALGLVHIFKSKLVVYGTGSPFPWFTDSYGFPDESSSIINAALDFPSAERMTFLQRVQNAALPFWYHYQRENWYLPTLETITRNGLGLAEKDLPSFREIEMNNSLVLLTTHLTIDQPRSLPPHVIPIGGAVITKKKKPMTKEIEAFINSTQSGFVFISFGTLVDFNQFSEEVQDELIDALRFLPNVRFLWKQSFPISKPLPDNVLMVEWVPQQTILGHPKIRGFVTHCGMGSTTELVHFGVPAVLIPILAEQDVHANVLESRGIGIRLEIVTLKKKELVQAITGILNNEKYRIAAKKLSAAFKDRIIDPISLGIWWIEYILRHDSSNEYLIPTSLRQSWWKRRQIDVWMALWTCFILIACITLLLLCFVLKYLFSVCFSANHKNRSKKQLKTKSS